MEQYNSVQQLLKKKEGYKDRKPVFPSTVIQAVFDGKTGASLEAILAQFNSIYIQYQGSPEATRNIIPVEMRRAGLTITYMNMDSETITERATSAVQKDNDHWSLNINWTRVDELSLSGDIAVSANGTWIINGEDTGVKAVGPKGDAGITPWLKTIDNKLHYSYDNVRWEPCSENIAAWFRFKATSSTGLEPSVGKFQISRDNKNWEDLSPEITNALRIAGYVATSSALPSGKPVGTIFGVGPTFAAEDTAHTNPIYRLYVYDGSKWVDNGTFTSIAAGVVQETGNSETLVMSQKATTEKLSELGSEVDKKTKSLSIVSRNVNDYTDNGFLNISGSVITNSDWLITANIPIKHGDNIEWCFGKENQNACILFYSNEGNVLSYARASGINGIRSIDVSSESLNSVSYIKASCNKSFDAGVYVLVNGLIVWQYGSKEKRVKTIEKEIIPNLKANILDCIKKSVETNISVSNYIDNCYLDTSGNIVSKDNWIISDFIPVDFGDVIEWKFVSNDINTASLVLYDQNGNFLNFYRASGEGGVRKITLDSDLLSNVGSIRASCFKSETGNYVSVNGAFVWQYGNDDIRFECIEDRIIESEESAELFNGSSIESAESEADFSIGDENGNVIVKFEKGHIKTRFFDSSQNNGYLNQYRGKVLSILGDSISTFKGYIPSGNGNEYTGTNHGVTDVSQQWWHQVMTELGLVMGVNESWAGSGVSGTDDGVKAISTSRLSRLGDNGNPDLIILQIGTNDYGKDFGEFEFFKLNNGGTINDYNVDKFRPAYSYIVEYLLLNYPNTRIVCMSPIYRNPVGFSNEGSSINSFGYSMNDMSDSIKKIADTYNVPFIDLSECGINIGNYKTYLQDNREDVSYQVHPNAKGFKCMANYIIGKLKSINLLNS